jgi:molybdopterin synthase catalytic subunit
VARYAVLLAPTTRLKHWRTRPAQSWRSAILAIIEAARARWPALGAAAIHHRIGRVELCETAVLVAVSSPQRPEASEAAQYCIDALKESVPMWKRDLWRGGSAWSGDT